MLVKTPKLNASQLRQSRVGEWSKIKSTLSRHPLVIVLDNVQDTFNIGSFFRLADALGAAKIYLCGPCVTPPNLKIHRSSVGTWKWLDWEHFQSTQKCLDTLKQKGYRLIACEQSTKSVSYLKADYHPPLAIIAGSETSGLSSSTLSMADEIVEIPLYGVNISLNTLIAASIIGYQAIASWQSQKQK